MRLGVSYFIWVKYLPNFFLHHYTHKQKVSRRLKLNERKKRYEMVKYFEKMGTLFLCQQRKKEIKVAKCILETVMLMFREQN